MNLEEVLLIDLAESFFVNRESNESISEKHCENIYQRLINLKDEPNFDNIIKLLSIKYAIYNYKNKEDNIIVFLKNNQIKTIIDMFLRCKELGTKLLKNFYDIYTLDNKKIIKATSKEDIDFIMKFSYVTSVSGLNEYLRKNIIDLLDFFDDDTDTLISMLLAMFNGAYVGVNSEYAMDIIKQIQHYKKYIQRLIYSDLYEDIDNMRDDEDDIVYSLADIVEDHIKRMDFSLPNDVINDVDMDEYMIGYFIDLCVDYRDRYENRLNIDRKKAKVLTRINPLCFLDYIE